MEKNHRFDVVSLMLMSFVLFSSFTLLTRNIAGPVVALLPMYWKPSFTDYALSGMPDFDQRQWGTYNWSDLGSWSHCGPVAVANSLWWLDSEFEPHPVAPPAVNDGFPLVQSYGPFWQGQWDDHDPLNVPYLVEHLAFLMDTDGRRTHQVHSGTSVDDMEAGLTQYLSWTGVNPQGDVNGDGIVNQTDYNIVSALIGSTPGNSTWNLAADIYPASTTYPPSADNIIDQNDLNLVNANMGKTGLFYEHTVGQPDFYFIEGEVEQCQDVVLLINYYVWVGGQTGWYEEPESTGHFVTVAGVDSFTQKLAITDPTQDAYEQGTILQGRVPIPHVHLPPEPPYTTHNNASLVSQDTYNVVQISGMGLPPCPGGDWALLNYTGYNPPAFAVITSAVITSPSGVRDVAVTNVTTCKDGSWTYGGPAFPAVGQNMTMHINVTVANQGDYTETFGVTVYVNTTIINQTQLILPNATSTVLKINWNATILYGKYTLSAVADILPCGETNTTNNNYTYGTVAVTIPGDVDINFNVNIWDLSLWLRANGGRADGHGSRPYNPNCDIDDNHVINIWDLHYWIHYNGKHYP